MSEDEEFEFRARAEAEASRPTTTPPIKQPLGVSDYLAAVPETIAKFGSSAIAAPISGLAGLVQGLGGEMSADERVSQVQNALTYEPRTQGGQALSDTLGLPFQKYAQGADWAGQKASDLTGSPMLGAGVNTALQGLPLLLGAKIPSVPKSMPALNPAVAAAGELGLRLTPEQAGGGFLGRAVQSLSGSAKLERSMSKKNAPVVNSAAKAEIGIPESEPFSDQSMTQAKAPHNAVYKEVSRLGQIPVDTTYQNAISNLTDRTGSGSFGFDVPPQIQALKEGYGSIDSFDAKDAVNKIRQLRKDSNANQKIYDPEKNALGQAQRGVADALENQLDRYVQTLSQTGAVAPDLINRYRDARMQLAKINSVENALDGANVSAKDLWKQKDRGVPLSGDLARIADAYGNFDRSLQDVSKIRDSGPFGVLDTLFGVTAGMAHPAALSAILARPLARSALASPLYQKSLQGAPLLAPSSPRLLGAAKLLPLIDQRQQPLLQWDQK